MTSVIALVAGAILFFWPFFLSGLPPDTPALAVAVGTVAALGVMEAATRRLDSGKLALLAALAAVDAALRLALVNGIGGFSPIFFLVLAAGYEFGPSYGFLVGSYSLLVSAVVTGGVGPWLPYETFAVGWVGMAAGFAGELVRAFRSRRAASASAASASAVSAAGSDSARVSGSAAASGAALGPPSAPGSAPGSADAGSVRAWWPDRLDIAVLVGVAIVTGFACGALMDVWGWVAIYRGPGDVNWLPGLSPAETLARFGRYYVLTSLAWDSFRAFGDALAILALGTPVLAALGRMRSRLSYAIVEPSPGPASSGR